MPLKLSPADEGHEGEGIAGSQQAGHDTNEPQRHDEEDQEGNADRVEQGHHQKKHRRNREDDARDQGELRIDGAEILTAPFQLVARGELQRFELIAHVGEETREAHSLGGRLDSDGGPPVPSHEDGVFPFEVDAIDDRVEGDGLRRERGPDLERAQVFAECPSFRFLEAHHDWLDVVLFAIEPHGQPVVGGAQGTGDIDPGNDGPTRDLVVVIRDDLAYGLAHVGADVLGVGAFREDFHPLAAKILEHLPVGVGRTADARFEGPGETGAGGELAHARQSLGLGFLHPLVDVIVDGLQRLEVHRVDDNLSVGLVGKLGIDRQIEAGRAATHEGADVEDALVFEQPGLDGLEVGGDLLDARALGRPVIDHELGAGGIGEKGTVHFLKSAQGYHEERDKPGDGEDAEPDGSTEKSTEAVVESTAEGIRLAFSFASLFRFGIGNHAHAHERNERDRDQPAEEKRDADDNEKGATVFAAVGLGGDARVEGRDRNEGRTEQGDGGSGRGLDGRPPSIHPLFQLLGNIVGHDDGGVDEHPKGDDKCPERDAVQVHAEQAEKDEGGQNGDGETGADNDAHAKTHAEGNDDEDNEDGFNKVDDKSAHGTPYEITLPGDAIDLDADGEARLEFVDLGAERVTGGGNIDAGKRCHRDTNGRPPLVTHLRHGRLEVAAPHRRDVLDADEVGAASGIRDSGCGGAAEIDRRVEQAGAHWEVLDLLDGGEISSDVEAEALVLHIDRAGVENDILRGKVGKEDLRGEAEFRHFPFLHIDVDDLRLRAPEFDAGDTGNEVEFLANELHMLFDFGIGEAVAGDGHDETVDEGKVVHDDGRGRARWQFAADIPDFLAHFVKNLRKAVGPVFLLDLNLDDGKSRARIGGKETQLRHFLERAFDLVR